MGLIDLDRVPGLLFPVLGKRLVELDVKFAIWKYQLVQPYLKLRQAVDCWKNSFGSWNACGRYYG